jgi:hypothetical protein
MIPVIALLTLLGATSLDSDEDWLRAKAHASEFRYDKALEAMQAVLAKEKHTDEDRARVLLRIGLIHATLLRDAAAVAAFARAIEHDAQASLPRDTSPRITPLFEQARARVAERPPPAEPEGPDAHVEPPPDAPPPDAELVDTPAPDVGVGVVGAAETGPSEEATGGDVFAVAGWSILGLGVAGAVLGTSAWAAGVGTFAYADGLTYQDEVAQTGAVGEALQIGGLIGAGVGAGIVILGGAVLFLDPA